MSAIDSNAPVMARSASGISQALRALPAENNPPAGLFVRPIANAEELGEVYRMTHDAYVEMGFIDPRPGGRLVHYPHLDAAPETTVLVAVEAGRIVGTNSLTFDGPVGLHVDEDFKAQADALRATGRKLASSYRINTLHECRQRSDIVKALIRETVRAALAGGVETCLFIFHKRHERIYRKLLNMTTLAERPEIACVRNFPAVLMRCDFEDLPGWCRAG